MDTHIFCKTKLNTQLQNEKVLTKDIIERVISEVEKKASDLEN